MTATITRPNWKKMLLQMLAGAMIGGAATMAALMTWDDLDPSDPAQMVAFVTGMIYALMGTMVGIGAIAPAAGARMLNVEDVEDLRDQRTILGLSAAACLFIGLLFLTLAAVPAGGNSGPFSRQVAAVLAGVCLVALIVLTLLTNRRADASYQHGGVVAGDAIEFRHLRWLGGAGSPRLRRVDRAVGAHIRSCFAPAACDFLGQWQARADGVSEGRVSI